MEIEEARSLFTAPAGYLNTAAYGLPPRPATDAVQATLDQWRDGSQSPDHWEQATGAARATFARLLGVPPGDVAVGSQVSQLLAPVASAVPDRARVVVPEIEFTSNLFPWLVHADRLTVTTVPADRLAEAVGDGCDVVAYSLVQSATGEVADHARIAAAARAAGATVVVDASQACGWLPFDAVLADVVVAGAYKWLMCPRGTAFAYIGPRVRDAIRPTAAGWYAADDPYTSFYGPGMRLAAGARRFDVSPAWLLWSGAAAALDLVERIGVPAIHAHDVALADRFRAGLGRPPGDSAIVTVDGPAPPGIRAAERAGRLRLSFHLYNTEDDVDRALAAVTG